MSSGYENSAHLYDLFDDKPNIPFFLGYARQVPQVLDIGAGTGRIAIPVAEAGTRVVAVEPSPAMRSEFARKLREYPDLAKIVDLIDGDAASFILKKRYPLAIMSGVFDHLLTDDERLAALDNVCDHLNPGATLVFDCFLGLMKDSPLKPAGQAVVDDTEYRRLVRSRILPDNKLEVLLVFEAFRKGEFAARIEEHSATAVLNRGDVLRCLEATGFQVTAEYRDYESTPYRPGCDLLVVEARRL